MSFTTPAGTFTFGQPVYHQLGTREVYYPPHPLPPPPPPTTGELIFIGVIIFMFLLIFIVAAIYGQPATSGSNIHPRMKFTNNKPYKIPKSLQNKFPFGNEYDPAIFSSGCDIDRNF